MVSYICIIRIRLNITSNKLEFCIRLLVYLFCGVSFAGFILLPCAAAAIMIIMETEAFTRYILLEKKYSPNTVSAYAADLAEFDAYLEENSLPADERSVDFNMVRGWVVSMMEKGSAPSSVNRRISSLRAYFRYCIRTGIVKSSPVERQGSVKEPHRVTVPYSVEEMEHLLSPELYEGDPDGLRNRTMIELFYGCGLRCAELCGVAPGDVDFGRKLLLVHGKGSKERYVPLHDRLLSSLSLYMDAEGMRAGNANENLLFHKNGKKLSPTLVYRIINKYLGLVTGKMKKSPHVLRHSFATHLIEQGADITSVKELLGHSSLVSTQVYTHTSLGKLKSVYNRAHPRGTKE